MPELRVVDDAEGKLRLEAGESFLPEDALWIRVLIGRAAPGTAIEIDFRHVRQCHDVALSILAQDLLGGRAAVAVLGMSQHHERLLAYLGVPMRAPDEQVA
jgi:hypothetical protein